MMNEKLPPTVWTQKVMMRFQSFLLLFLLLKTVHHFLSTSQLRPTFYTDEHPMCEWLWWMRGDWQLFLFLLRGNSKYHYYGLRIKAGSSLLRLMEDQQHLAMRQQPFSQKQRYKHKYLHPDHQCTGVTMVGFTLCFCSWQIEACA